MRISDWSSDVCSSDLPAELPARAALVGTAPDLPAEADRKGVGLDPEPAAGEIMPQLVDEHERPDHEHECDDGEEHARRVDQATQTFTRSPATDRASPSIASTATTLSRAAEEKRAPVTTNHHAN